MNTHPCPGSSDYERESRYHCFCDGPDQVNLWWVINQMRVFKWH